MTVAHFEHRKLDLTTFLLSISTAAFMALGVAPEQEGTSHPSGQGRLDFELARQNIDLLELIHEKTQGNRTAEEDRLLDHLLFETRMRFVDAQKKLSK